MYKKIIQNKIFVILISILVVAFLAIFTLKSFLTYSLIEKKLGKYLNLKIELIKPKTTFDYKFNLNFKADYIKAFDLKTNKKYIEIEEPVVSFKPLNLLIKKLSVKKLDAKSANIAIKREENGKIDLIENINLKNIPFKNQKLNISKLNSDIQKIHILFEDDYLINSKNELTLENSKLKISKRAKKLEFSQIGNIKTTINNKSQTANLSLNAQLAYPLKDLTLQNSKISANIKDFNLHVFSSIFEKYISKEINNVKGLLSIDFKTQDDFLLNAQIKNLSLISKDKKITPYEQIDFKNVFNIEKNNLIIKSAKLLAKDLNFETKGKIEKIFSKHPSLEITNTVKNTQLGNLFHFIPDNLIVYNPKGIPTLKNSNFKGILSGEVKTKFKPLNMQGSLKVENVHIPNYPKPKVQNDVNLYFLNDKLKVYTKVYTPNGENVIVEGLSNLDDSFFGQYNISSSNNVELAFAQLYLVPIQQIIGFNLGPVPIMDIKGYGNINIKTQGTIFDPHVFGNFKANHASAQLDGLDGILSNANCELIFDNQTLNIKEVKGKMGTSDILISGKSNILKETEIDIDIKNGKTSEFLKLFKNSEVTKKYSYLLKNIAATAGDISAKIKLKGTVEDFEKEDFLNNLSQKGRVSLKNNTIILNNKLSAKKINGTVEFGEKQKGFLEFFVGNSKFNTDFLSNTSLDKIAKKEPINVKLITYSNEFNSKDIQNELNASNILNDSAKNILKNFTDTNFLLKAYIESEGKIDLTTFDLSDLKNSGYIVGLNSVKNQNVKFNKGIIKLNNDKIIADNLDLNIKNGNIKANGEIKKALSKKPVFDIDFKIKDINLEELNNLVKNAKITSLFIKNANISIKNNFLKLNPLSIEYNTLPMFISANVKNINTFDEIDAHFSTILTENNTDSAINPYLTYPIKIKDEVPLKGNFKGNLENYSIDFSAIFPENSDIYFSGANLGDTAYKRELKGKIEAEKQSANINNIKLIKYIANQNKKINPITIITTNGKIKQKQDGLSFENFKIATQSPLNVRILNLIFKKSLLKKGVFECAFLLNGNVKTPKLTGRIHLQDLDIPLYNSQINSIRADISNDLINGEILAKNNESDAKIKLSAKNSLVAPYVIEKLNISSNKININDLLKSASIQPSKSDIDKKIQLNIQPQDVIIKQGEFDFKNVEYGKISAQNLKGNYEYKNNIFNLKSISANIAQGEAKGSGTYSITNTNLKLKAHLENCMADILAENFLNLTNQIYGKINGSLVLDAKNLNTPDGIKTVKSDVIFSVENGKMPKLGSLEYLLRAGNLFKSGIMGLSLNNIIQVLTPYKTGEFEQISGLMHITDAKIENLELFSKGKNLSLYSKGSYDILENFADIKIYGKLSNSVSTSLGKIGNANLAQFFEILNKKNKQAKEEELQKNLDKIPSIEIKENPKYFSAKILGDINRENYVKSFNWE